ncbi:diguanylate cyclase domain-containing protein [Zoogloea sp.]|uniref:sensor domain-containing protein n=1 Tax=Zoogloea sp. TaxID=49181 RepID=UPI0035B4EC51
MEKDIWECLPDFADLLLDAVFVVDAQGRIVYVSAACEGIFGYTPAEMTGRPMIDFVAPEDRARTAAEAHAIIACGQRIGFENRYRRKDGRDVHVMWSARWLEAQRLRIGVARDVTEFRRTQVVQAATYAVSDAAHRAPDLGALLPEIHRIVGDLVPVAGFAVATWDATRQAIDFPYQMDAAGRRDAFHEPVAGACCAEVVRKRQHLLLRGEALSALARRSDDWAGVGLVLPLVPQRDAVGALILRSLDEACFSDKEIEMLHFVAAQIATAIERSQLKAELQRAALYDDLTGLPNRKLFRDRVASALARCQRSGGRMALLYVDVDNFKQVNDAHGHAAGDLLLQEIARRLGACVRQVDTVARLGGDEFVVVIEEIEGFADARTVATKIRDALARPVDLGACPLQITASVGIAIHPDHGNDVETLMTAADHAMYRRKRQGGTHRNAAPPA